jgi:hypothetical protein
MDNSDEQKLLKQTFKFVGLENAYQELVSTQEAKIDILKGYMTNEELKKELIESLTEKLHLDSAKKRKLKLALSNIEKIKWESNIEEMAIDNFNDGRRREMKLPQLEERKKDFLFYLSKECNFVLFLNLNLQFIFRLNLIPKFMSALISFLL